jgi:hypothetical protein
MGQAEARKVVRVLMLARLCDKDVTKADCQAAALKRSGPSSPQSVQAPWAAAGRGEIKEHEAIEDGRIPAIDHGKNAISPERMNATGRVKMPGIKSAPPTKSIKPATHGSDRNATPEWSDDGKPSNFVAPCSKKRSAATMRKTLKRRGAQTVSSVSMVMSVPFPHWCE